jgi:hypothetical protein
VYFCGGSAHLGGIFVPEPLTLAALGGLALSEGIKFLYKQAGEALKQWRAHREQNKAAGAPQSPSVVAPEAAVVLDGKFQPVRMDTSALERFEAPIRDLRGQLSGYADETDPVVEGDGPLLERADALRQMLEAVYGQRITFKGEDRAPSGTAVSGEIDVDQLEGYAAAVRAKRIEGGTTTGVANARVVGEKGTLIGVDVDEIR